jgi:2-iminobutanoate/2-iminopropanoate deaminase
LVLIKAVRAGGMVYVSGCVGISPELKSLVSGGVGSQARQALENLKNIIESSGSSLQKVVKCTVLLTDMANFPEINQIYGEYFPVDPPARATFAVAGLPVGALIEIEAICIA